ncbi:MAG: shikimate dehydrogenase family protein [Flavobacteriales bacterium]
MRQFGLIGKNLNYSFSKDFFDQKFELENINNCSYNLFELENLDSFKNFIVKNKIEGLNITIPYKQEIIQFVDELSIEAKAINAVNCLKIANQKIIGHNTDYIGFSDSIKPLLKPVHKKALILGSGGASKAIAFAFTKMGVDYSIVSRKKELNYECLDKDMLNDYKVIINCTPLGTSPIVDECPNIPYKYLTEQHLLYDLVYNPKESLFLKKGKQKKATTKNGFEMLKIQALKSWEIWNS